MVKDILYTFMLDHDFVRVVRGYKRLGIISGDLGDDESLAALLHSVFEPIMNTRMEDLQFADLFMQSLELAEQMGDISAPQELSLLGKQFLYFERYVKGISPDYLMVLDPYLIKNIFPEEAAGEDGRAARGRPDGAGRPRRAPLRAARFPSRASATVPAMTQHGTFGADTTTDEVLEGVDLSGRLAVVTGGYGGLGRETARALAAHGANVVIAGRDPQRLADTAAQLTDALPVGSGRIETLVLDLASLDSVRAAAAELTDRHPEIHLLIDNAGVMACPPARTADGFEMQFGTNHLGHFLFTLLLLDALRAGAPSRVVVLSSAGHRVSPIRWDDLNFDDGEYHNWTAYGQSKTANALFALELDRRLGADGVHAYSVHPGVIMTELGRHMGPADFEWMAERASRRSGGDAEAPGSRPRRSPSSRRRPVPPPRCGLPPPSSWMLTAAPTSRTAGSRRSSRATTRRTASLPGRSTRSRPPGCGTSAWTSWVGWGRRSLGGCGRQAGVRRSFDWRPDPSRRSTASGLPVRR